MNIEFKKPLGVEAQTEKDIDELPIDLKNEVRSLINDKKMTPQDALSKILMGEGEKRKIEDFSSKLRGEVF